MSTTMTIPDKIYLTRRELAARWRMSWQTVANMACEGRGPAFIRVGGRALYAMSDVIAFEAARMVQPRPNTPDRRQRAGRPTDTDTGTDAVSTERRTHHGQS
jgi:hypothetical protein